MKKLIVLSVVFALVASAAFAVDVGGTVFGLVTPLQSDTGKNAADEASKVTGVAGFERVRLEGGGEAGDGAFGGWIRLGDDLGAAGLKGAYAYWKPVDAFKMLIGGNPDGMYGKEGVTGWMFHQMPYDGGVAIGGNNVWGYGAGWPWFGNGIDGDPHQAEGGEYFNTYAQLIKTRDVFYGGFGGNGLHLNIKPIDMLGINLILPFFGDPNNPPETADVFGNMTAQLDVNLDFGNIAITYDAWKAGDDNGGKVYAYFGGSFGDLGLDVGVSIGFNSYEGDDAKEPIGVGLGVKFATDAFGVKFRTVATLAGGDKATRILAELLPYFPLGDNLAAVVGVGLSMTMPEEGDSEMGWHFNPYIRVGEEWGAQFLAGVKVWSGGSIDKDAQGNDGIIHWSVPIAIMVSF
jgi:hypothetical protein